MSSLGTENGRSRYAVGNNGLTLQVDICYMTLVRFSLSKAWYVKC